MFAYDFSLLHPIISFIEFIFIIFGYRVYIYFVSRILYVFIEFLLILRFSYPCKDGEYYYFTPLVVWNALPRRTLQVIKAGVSKGLYFYQNPYAVLERNTKEPENWHSFGAIGLWSLGSFHAIYWGRWSHSTLLSLRAGLSISVCCTGEYICFVYLFCISTIKDFVTSLTCFLITK